MSVLAPRSLFGRMVWVLLAGLVVAQLLSMAIHRHERSQMLARSNSLMAAQRIRDRVKWLDAADFASRQTLIERLNEPDFAIALATGNSQPVTGDGEDGAVHPFLRSTLQALLGTEYPFRILTSDPQSPFIKVQVRLRDGSWLDMHYRRWDETEAWPSHLMVQLLILVIFVLGLSLVAVRWVTNPLIRLANAADELGKDMYRAPLNETGPLEVRRAAHAFNTMQARLVSYIQDRTRFLAAISHDLKTPITRLRLRTELLDDQRLRDKFEKDLDDMEGMVLATLDFMRGVDQQESVQPVDVMALLESLQADAQDMGLEVNIVGSALLPYSGKPMALKRCISNLIDNAIQYGRRATIEIRDGADQLTLVISDQGPGIPEAQLEQVFEPFYRLEGSRSRDSGGTGLGTSIARNIAQAHGGRLTLKNASNVGLKAILTLPRH